MQFSLIYGMRAQLQSEMQFPKVTTFVQNFFSLPVLGRAGKKVHEHSDRPYVQHSF